MCGGLSLVGAVFVVVVVVVVLFVLFVGSFVMC